MPSSSHSLRLAIVGGGAAGFFAALSCAEANRRHEVTIFERSSQFLAKVRISGGGRCNVTHGLFDAREFVLQYPRGGRPLISPLTRFGAEETVTWFENRGVRLKTEADGRMFPVSDSSTSVINCFLREAMAAGIRLRSGTGVSEIVQDGGGFHLQLTNETGERFDRVLLATGGTRNANSARLAAQLGHTLSPPVPSLFSFESQASIWRELAGISVSSVRVVVLGTKLAAQGPILITHRGLSGPAILRLSAWGARELHERDYRFTLLVSWLGQTNRRAIESILDDVRGRNPKRLIASAPPLDLPARLWRTLMQQSGIGEETRWAHLGREQRLTLVENLAETRIPIDGQSVNKEEFVTCGGVDLAEVDFKTMESRLVPGIYFAGELLDIDGITGGFNFQSAWTTGWIAGQRMAKD